MSCPALMQNGIQGNSTIGEEENSAIVENEIAHKCSQSTAETSMHNKCERKNQMQISTNYNTEKEYSQQNQCEAPRVTGKLNKRHSYAKENLRHQKEVRRNTSILNHQEINIFE